MKLGQSQNQNQFYVNMKIFEKEHILLVNNQSVNLKKMFWICGYGFCQWQKNLDMLHKEFLEYVLMQHR